MADAPRDANRIVALIGVDSSDLTVPALVAVDTATNRLLVNGITTVTDVVPGTGATNLGKAIDSAAGGTDTGVATLAIRDDTLTTLTPIDGDYVPLRVNSTGALHVTGGGGGTEFNVDDVTGATDAGSAMLAVRDDALTTLTPADGDYVRLRVNSTGALHVTGGGGGTEYTEDEVSANPIVGSAIIVERDDILSTVTPVEADNIGLRGTAEGALWVQDFNSDAILTAVQLIDDAISGNEMQVDIIAALPAGTNNIGDVDILSLPASTNTIEVVGDAADGTAVAGNPVLIGGSDGTNVETILVTSNGRQVFAAGAAAADGGSNTLSQPFTSATQSFKSAVAGHVFNGTTWDRMRGDTDGLNIQGGVAHDAVDAGNPTKLGGRAQEPTAQPDEVANDDRVDALFDRAGRSAIYQGYPRIYADINDATSGNNTIIAAQAAGKKILITSVLIVSDGTVDCRFESGADGTALTGQIPLQAREGFSANDPWGLFETAAATLLNLELSAAINVHGWVSGHVIDD